MQRVTTRVLVAALLAIVLTACQGSAAPPDPSEPDGALGEKPRVTIPNEEPPTELTVEDLAAGDGDEASPGEQVSVHYVGVAYSSGDEFDSSWESGEPAQFSLAQVVPGFAVGIGGGEGIEPMKVGGRRRITMPPEMAYGDSPPPGSSIEPGETLVFVVDLLAVVGPLEVPSALSEEPEVTIPDEAPPTEIAVEDLIVGDGDEAGPGVTVVVNYVGVAYSTGEEFDSSWGGEPAEFSLAQVVPGFAIGIGGGDGVEPMKVGGRRRITMPPDMGYGDDPPPGSTIQPGETLVFVVDLLAIR